MATEDDLLAKLQKLKLSGETWELGVRKAHSWMERKKGELYRPYQLFLVMQRRWDEAEAAFRRALEIDPEYQLARDNLP